MTDQLEAVFEQLDETAEENGYFTRVHVARYLAGVDGIDTPATAHEYFDALEDDDVVEEVDRPSERHALRYEFGDDIDLGTVADEYDPDVVLGDDGYDEF